MLRFMTMNIQGLKKMKTTTRNVTMKEQTRIGQEQVSVAEEKPEKRDRSLGSKQRKSSNEKEGKYNH